MNGDLILLKDHQADITKGIMIYIEMLKLHLDI